MREHRDKSGFTLIELSIVLVVIGLIIGGVLAGQSLIKASEMRSIISQIESYEAARNTFKLKYNCMPGDCANATDFGLAPNNGNGNKYLEYYGNPNSGGVRLEMVRFWSHLANAGLIEGSYTGLGGSTTGGAASDYVIGENVPATVRDGLGIGLFYRNSDGSWTPFYGEENPGNAHIYVVGRESSATNVSLYGGGINTYEMQGMDEKMDDGSANTGMVRVRRGQSTHGTNNCTPGSSPYSYRTNQPNGWCSAAFLWVP